VIPRPNSGLYIVAAVLIALYVAHCLTVNYVSDDAFISFRYVKNLLEGHGLVFNPGERVEGYTNFLWVMLLAAAQFLLPSASLLRISQFLGILFGALTIFLVLRFSWRIRQPFWPLGLLGGALLAAHSGFVAWSTGGLENSLFAFLIFAGAYSHVVYLDTGKRFWLAPLVFALATMTRPDSALLFGLTGLHAFFMERSRSGKWISQRIVLWGLVFAAAYLPYFLWRFGYYGHLFPNTFYAKTAGGSHWLMYARGLRYLKNYLVVYGLFVPLLPLALLLRKKWEPWLGYFALLMAGYLSYVVYVGGDGLAFYRFVSYLAPILCVLIQEGIVELYQGAGRPFPRLTGWKVAAPTALLVFVSLAFTMRQGILPIIYPQAVRWHEPQCQLSFPGNGTDHSYRWFDNYFVDRLAIAAEWLQQNAPPGSLVASTPAGSVAYHMDLPVIDMLGLNDEHIAHSSDTFRGTAGKGRAGHEKGDGRYVLSRSPDYILMGNVAVLPFPLDETTMVGKLVLKSEHEIWDQPEFHENYELVSVPLAKEGVFRYFTFYRKKRMASVRPLADKENVSSGAESGRASAARGDSR